MIVLIKIYVIFMNIIYKIFKLLPVDNKKIVFISRQTNKPSIDFRMLNNEIKLLYPEYKTIFLCKRIEKNIKDFIFKGMVNYFKQMYYLSTSSICITDGYNITISILKHKNKLKIIQMWHSLGAIKKFGYESLITDRDKILSKYLKMHNNYDYIICSSFEMIKYLKKCFNYEENKFIVCGLPRIDYILTKDEYNKAKVYNKYPLLKNKKIIVYAPTFRKDNNYHIDELINTIDYNKYALVVKLHKYTNYKTDNKDVIVCKDFSVLQLLSVCNYLITDYSAVSLEAAIKDIPIFLYTYDIKDYGTNTGLNKELLEPFKDYMFKDIRKLYKKLDSNNYDINIVKQYKNKYIKYLDGSVTYKLARFIVEGCDVDE